MSICDSPDEKAASKEKSSDRVDMLIERMKAAKKARKSIDKDEKKDEKNSKSRKTNGVSSDKDRRNKRKKEPDEVRRNGDEEIRPKSRDDSDLQVNGHSSDGKLGRSDSPSLDLIRMLQPRGKRKCVIESEGKRATKKRCWWTDEDEEDEEIVSEEKPPTKKGKLSVEDGKNEKGARKQEKKRKRSRKKDAHQPDKESASPDSYDQQDDDPTTPSEQTPSKSFVFSTAMANRAGHYVQKGDYKSITAYHAAHVWDTPYLNAEIHCRPFIPELEDRQPKEEKYEKHETSALNRRSSADSGDTNGALESKVKDFRPLYRHSISKEEERSPEQPPVSTEERELSVDEIEKDRVIQAAKQMSRLANRNSPPVGYPRGNTDNDSSLTTLRSNFLQVSSSLKSENDSTTETESESSPQTVPKIVEAPDKDDVPVKTELNGDHNVCSSGISDKDSDQQSVHRSEREEFRTSPALSLSPNTRDKELSSPPQLVPTFKSNIVPRSYPADVTNVKVKPCYPADVHVKEQFQMQHHSNVSDRDKFGKYERRSPEENLTRPSVLNMSCGVIKSSVPPTSVRSSIDVAEKALKELRTNSFLHSQSDSYLRHNGHHPAFPIPSHHHAHTSAFNSHIPNNILPGRGSPAASVHGHPSRPSFIPPSSSLLPTEDPVRGLPSRSSSNSVGMPDFAHRTGHAPSHGHLHTHEKDRRDAEHLNNLHRISAFHRSLSPTQNILSMHRPSSLPMHSFHSREHPKLPLKSFSVESLTGVDDRKERSPHLDRIIPERPIPERPIPDRSHLMDRIHIPDGHVFQNGINKKHPEDWSPVHPPHGHVDRRHHDSKLLFDLIHEKESRSSNQRSSIPPHVDPRSPMRMIPPYLPRPVSNGSPRESYPMPPGHMQQIYSHMNRLGINPFTANGMARFSGR